MWRSGLLVLAVGCAHSPGFLYRELAPADWVVAERAEGGREVLLRTELEQQVALGLRERPAPSPGGLGRYGIDDEVSLKVGEVRTFRLLDSQAAKVATRGGDAARIYWSLPVDQPVQTADGFARRRSAELHLVGGQPGTEELLLEPLDGPKRRVTIKVSR